MKEIFKDIKGFEGFYQVSNTGKIKSVTRRISSTYKRLDGKLINERILKERISGTTDYAGVTLCKNNIKHQRSVHRLVALTFIPNPENKPQVNHKDLIKRNNNVDNLEWTTCSENMKHAYLHGVCTLKSDFVRTMWHKKLISWASRRARNNLPKWHEEYIVDLDIYSRLTTKEKVKFRYYNNLR